VCVCVCVCVFSTGINEIDFSMFRHIKGDVFHFIDVKILSPKMCRERHWRQPIGDNQELCSGPYDKFHYGSTVVLIWFYNKQSGQT